jgi:hypothetical protein
MFVIDSELMSKRRIWLTDEQKTRAAERYLAGDAPDTIADTLGVCANNIRNALRGLGVEMRNRAKARTKLRLRANAFDSVTPASAYWIGFLFADGALSVRKIGSPVLAVGLAEKDRGHIVKLRDFLGSEHKITRYRQRGSETVPCGDAYWAVRLSIRSAEIGAALLQHGMCAKSLQRIAPDYLKSNAHFWRGLVDGDGHVGVSRGKPRLGLCGGQVLMEQFVAFLRSNSIGLHTEVRAEKNIHRVDLNCGSAVDAVRLLYTDDAPVALERKQKRARAIISGDVIHIAE